MKQEFVIVLITISIQVINCVVDVLRYKDSRRIAKHDRKRQEDDQQKKKIQGRSSLDFVVPEKARSQPGTKEKFDL